MCYGVLCFDGGVVLDNCEDFLTDITRGVWMEIKRAYGLSFSYRFG